MGIVRSPVLFTLSVVTDKPKTDTMCLSVSSVLFLNKCWDNFCSVTQMYIYIPV